jgi:hypothetical protein
VRLNHFTFLPRCHDYLIDWGDGSSFDRAPSAAGEPCLLEKTWIETGHVYDKTGSYEIRIRTNEYRTSVPAAASPYFEKVIVDVP